jgi:hypothetical protein
VEVIRKTGAREHFPGEWPSDWVKVVALWRLREKELLGSILDVET